MNPTDDISPELQALIDRLLDGMGTAEDMQQLEAHLRGNSSAQAYFRRYCQLHINLDTATRVQRAVDVFKNRALTTAQPAPATPTSFFVHFLWEWIARRGRGFFRSPWTSLALSAIILVMVGLGLYFRPFAATRQQPGLVAGPQNAELNVIRIRLDTDESRTVGLGNQSRVFVEGPADLELIGTSRGRLHRGRVRITKIDGDGFVLETPRGVVTDLSTEFGVGVAGDSATDIVVFDGAVELAAGGNPERVRLVQGEGVVVGETGQLDRVMSIVTDGEQLFRRSGELIEGQVPLITDVRDNIRISESKQFYEIVADGLGEDALCYVDRPEHDWNGMDKHGMPAYLLGADYVKTFCSDRVRADLKISVTLSRPAKLYVFMDDRVPPPDWLRAGFTDTGDKIGQDCGKLDLPAGMRNYVRAFGAGNSIDYRHSVWVRVVDKPGVVDLGPNPAASHGAGMYGIAATPIQQATPNVAPVPVGVRPIAWSRFAGLTGVSPGDTFGRNLIGLIQRQSGHLYKLIQATYAIEHYSAFGEAEGYRINRAGIGDSVRTLAHFAWGNAATIKSGVFDPSLAGVSESEALHRTELAIRGVAMTHVSNSSVPKPYHWGQGMKNRSWQAAYWASRDAQAAWMLWDSLSVETRQAVATMAKYEADAFINYTVPYWRSKDGTPLTPGDTKAEENGWNSRILVIAQAMMPDDPNVSLWRQKASELMISSYSRQSDIYNPAVVDGRPVSTWLNGYNTFDDGVLVNHNILHPDYMAAHTLTYDTLVDATLAGQYIPASAFFNEQITWNAMTTLNFTAGTNPYGAREARTIIAPGGTLFHKKSDGSLDAVLYFPNGNDWSFNRDVDSNHILFLTYGRVRRLDADQSTTALDWSTAQLKALEVLQNRPGHTGNLYEAGDWNGDLTTIEMDAYRELTESWLVHWLDQHNMISPVGAWGACSGRRLPAGDEAPESGIRS